MYNPYEVKIPRLTKAVAEQSIAMALRVHPQQLNFVKLQESPKEWKHACVPTGVAVLTPRRLPYGMTFIEFAVCGACGKVVYTYEDQISVGGY